MTLTIELYERAGIYITTPKNVEEDVMLDMIDLTIELYERAGIYITGRINHRDTHNVDTTPYSR